MNEMTVATMTTILLVAAGFLLIHGRADLDQTGEDTRSRRNASCDREETVLRRLSVSTSTILESRFLAKNLWRGRESMNALRLVLLLAALSLGFRGAATEIPDNTFFSGNDIYDLCQHAKPMAQYYVAGLFDEAAHASFVIDAPRHNNSNRLYPRASRRVLHAETRNPRTGDRRFLQLSARRAVYAPWLTIHTIL
jgi:hypothetical protein